MLRRVIDSMNCEAMLQYLFECTYRTVMAGGKCTSCHRRGSRSHRTQWWNHGMKVVGREHQYGRLTPRLPLEWQHVSGPLLARDAVASVRSHCNMSTPYPASMLYKRERLRHIICKKGSMRLAKTCCATAPCTPFTAMPVLRSQGSMQCKL